MSLIKDAVDAAKQVVQQNVRDYHETQPRSPGAARKLEGTKAQKASKSK
jgi:hypothetical protein